MSTPSLHRLHRRLRTRQALSVAAWAVPLLVAVAVLLWRFAPESWAAVGVAVAMVVSASWAARAARAVALTDVIRVLDGSSSALEDSSDLVLIDAATLTPLQRLQRARVLERLDTAAASAPVPAWPTRRIAMAIALALLACVCAFAWPGFQSPPVPAAGPSSVDATVVPTRTQIVSARIDIEAPAYTALPPRSEPSLELEAAEGSTLRWHIALDPAPVEARLTLHDGTTVALTRDGDAWTGTHVLGQSTLYRLDIGDAPALVDDRLYRLDAIADQAPEIRVIEPDRTLTLLEQEQPTWLLQFEVSDDYGVGPARLSITLAQGSGEQVTVSGQEVVLRAEPGTNRRLRRYRHALDLGAVGFASGDDLIVRLGASDTRTPTPNSARSASYILRWPAKRSGEAEGIDGIVQKVLPAYFRSQRQIIIDSEALIAERPALGADEFVQRSDAIGVDQKILRLRYGQFLGEEFESAGGPPPVTSTDADGPDHGESEDEGPAAALPEGHSADDGHDHAPAAFGSASDIVAEYGHMHDHAEAATLLDPETKRILKAALAEMWQAELQLRLGKPGAALPYENRALEYIKQVQQSTRIYLARVGLELPPVEETRRLTGDRGNARSRRVELPVASSQRAPVVAFQRALEAGTTPDVDAFEAWLKENESALDDALGVYAALDAWRRDAGCSACRDRLLDALWPLLPVPATGVAARREGGVAADAYLDALNAAEPP